MFLLVYDVYMYYDSCFAYDIIWSFLNVVWHKEEQYNPFLCSLLFSIPSLLYGRFTTFAKCYFSERAGAEVIECACVIEIPELKVSLLLFFFLRQLRSLNTVHTVSLNW